MSDLIETQADNFCNAYEIVAAHIASRSHLLWAHSGTVGPWAPTKSQPEAVTVMLSMSAALPSLSLTLHHSRLLPSMIAEMQELPEDLLLLIARRVLKKKEGLSLWCKLSSACRRLWMFQLPSEPTYFLDNRLPDQGECFL